MSVVPWDGAFPIERCFMQDSKSVGEIIAEKLEPALDEFVSAVTLAEEGVEAAKRGVDFQKRRLQRAHELWARIKDLNVEDKKILFQLLEVNLGYRAPSRD
jgi:hypothetical protein